MSGIISAMSGSISDERTKAAIEWIALCCPHVGAFFGPSGVNDYIRETAIDMSRSSSAILFPDRYLEHVAYAMLQVADHRFLSPPSAEASAYLATRFEYYFRVLSSMLDSNGSWISPEHRTEAAKRIDDKRLKSPSVSSVSLAYKIMKLNMESRFAGICETLDMTLHPQPRLPRETRIHDLGDRIERIRNSVGHGEAGDPSAESLFYGLLTSIVFYNQQ